MRFSRTSLVIVGLFLPFVMGSQTFGTTEISAFDIDFLQAPPSPRAFVAIVPAKVASVAWQTFITPWSVPESIGTVTFTLEELLQ